MYTYIPSLLNLPPTSPHPTPLGHHRAPSWTDIFLSLKIKNSNANFYLPLTTSRSNLTFLPALCNCLIFLSQLSGFRKKICSILIQGINTGKIILFNVAVLQEKVHFRIRGGGKTRSFYVWRPDLLPRGVHWPADQPPCLPYLSLPAGKGSCRPTFPAPGLCAFFVAELTWLDFPSEVIIYLSFPYKISLKNWQPLALLFCPEN